MDLFDMIFHIVRLIVNAVVILLKLKFSLKQVIEIQVKDETVLSEYKVENKQKK